MFVAINAPPNKALDEASQRFRYERFTFAPISREAATRYLTALVEDMRRGVHDYLLPAQIHAALSYYYENPEAIDAQLKADEEWDERFEREKAEFLKR